MGNQGILKDIREILQGIIEIHWAISILLAIKGILQEVYEILWGTKKIFKEIYRNI